MYYRNTQMDQFGGPYGEATQRRAQSKRRWSYSAMLYDIALDWMYYFMSAFAIVICLWLFYQVFFVMQPLILVNKAVKLIETYFWTSVFLVCLMGVITVEMLERQRRSRKGYGRKTYYDDPAYGYPYQQRTSLYNTSAG